MSTYTFSICGHVQNKIESYSLNESDKAILIRCIGGYSQPLDAADKIEKMCYRLGQHLSLYPDWQRSIKLLQKREFDRFRISLDVTNNLSMLYVAMRISDIVSKAILKELIKANR